MLVFDRTGSMCWTWSGANDPACTKLHNAKSGMETLLSALDPQVDRVGLVVLPPVVFALCLIGGLLGGFAHAPHQLG